MLDHHIQRSIVYRLALLQDARFSDLKPDMVENKLFTYHLKKVVNAGFVNKNANGHYSLTPEGRRLGVHVLEGQKAMLDRAYSVLFLVIRRKTDGAWLLYQRKNHPLINRIGFMHCTPTSKHTTTETAQAEVKHKTGLDCSFTALGGGYFRVFDTNKLEGFTHFTLLVCEDAKGELKQNDAHARYWWEDTLHPTDDQMLPNMEVLIDLYKQGKHFFIEETLHV